MMKICESEKCTGCSACVDVCPKNCIKMEPDAYGFEQSVVDEEACIHCGACKRVCQNNNEQHFVRPIKCYAACIKDTEARKKSASGGIAYALYQNILDKGGVAYGVDFDEEFHLKFYRGEKAEDIARFRGSKYTYSDMQGTYKALKEDLQDGRLVLFVGTSCQCSGLLGFLGKKYDNLYTVDLICHGMPGAAYLKEYLTDVEKKHGKKVTEISFRDNDVYRMKVCAGEETLVQQPAKENPFMAGYTRMLIYRDSCYDCKFARPERVTDITIGDYWGSDRRNMLAPVEAGKSVILSNSPQGDALVRECMNTCVLTEKSLDDVVSKNEQLRKPSKKSEYRQELLEVYKESGYVNAAKQVIPKVLESVAKSQKKEPFVKRACRRIKGKYKQWAVMNKRGKFFRVHVRNKWDRKRLTNTDFTILSNTCIGGVISHDLGLQFKSPTVNLYMTPTDFVKFLENLEHYLAQEIVPVPYDKDYPVGRLGDILIYFKHYHSIEEAIQKWKERIPRINYDNVFVMMTDRWCCPESTFERFENLPFENKVCFTAEEYPQYPHCVQIKKHRDNGCVWIITNIMNLWGKRLYQYGKDFDYIKWLNNGKRG